MDMFVSASQQMHKALHTRQQASIAGNLDKLTRGLELAESACAGDLPPCFDEFKEDMSQACRLLIAKAKEVKEEIEGDREKDISPKQAEKRQRVEATLTSESPARWFATFDTFFVADNPMPLFCLKKTSDGKLHAFHANPLLHCKWKVPNRILFEKAFTYQDDESKMLWSNAQLVKTCNVRSKKISFMRFYLAEPNVMITEEEVQKLTTDDAGQIQNDVHAIGENFYGPEANPDSSMLLPRSDHPQLLIGVLHTQKGDGGLCTSAIGVMPVAKDHQLDKSVETLLNSCEWL